jgi:hypothetical protein
VASVGAVVSRGVECIASRGEESLPSQTKWFGVGQPRADGLPEREVQHATTYPFADAGKEEIGKDATPTAKGLSCIPGKGPAVGRGNFG